MIKKYLLWRAEEWERQMDIYYIENPFDTFMFFIDCITIFPFVTFIINKVQKIDD